ncbi:MAG: YfdX family protein [Acidimicrobiales bacterium]|nr:YfdX family protein [Hyphomonadaceae bacterium]RZV34409.1 MAG: YfdX family protein [Acidimicrobiales bacterium]
MTLQKQTKFLKHLTAGLLGSTILIASPAVAGSAASISEAGATTNVETMVNDETKKQTDEKRQKLLKRAIEAVSETDKAIAALDEDNAESALEALARATGELDIILAREPSLALAPIDVNTTRLDTMATVTDVRSLRKDIRKLVKEGDLQDARRILRDFGSEIRIQTTNLPLATYPEALKTAAALIDDGDLEAAKLVLDTALGTFVIQDVIVPIPLIRAQSMLDLAERYVTGELDPNSEDKAELTEEERIEAAQVLRTNAARQIELAKAFGYGDKRLYRELEDDLDKMKKLIRDKGESAGLFSSLSRQIDALSESGLAPYPTAY